jgi:polyphosphate kinase 2 (PPK2 family)
MASAAPATPAAAAPPSAAPAKPPRRPRARRAAAGDVAPRPTPTGLEDFAVTTNLDAARESRLGAMQDVISGLPPEEAVSLLKAALKERRLELEDARPNPDEELAKDWREGGYPYRNLMLRRNYERQKYRLQVELLKLQAWVKETGQKVVILFEGRDAAGKGGHHQAFHGAPEPSWRARGRPREAHRERARSVVLPALREHLPTNGEIVMFDRSWYNRAGVERVMGFCSDQEYTEFMRQAPEFERMLARNGTHLIKFWFSVSRDEQRRRFRERGAPAQAVEAVADRPGFARQVGRLHQGQGGDVLPYGHRRRAVDGHQVELQEARAPQRHALRPAQAALRPTRTCSASATSTR